LEEEKEPRRVVVDTYTLLAIVYDEVGGGARRILEGVRRGRVEGLVPVTVAYEYVVHWLRGRIPALKSIDEVVTYLKSYFKIVTLDFYDYIEAARIKVDGDRMLREAEDESLRTRRLSIVDSTVITVARKEKAPIVSGDKDLAYVARRKGIEVIW
jgi:predicted nucleic acid-binding protein